MIKASGKGDQYKKEEENRGEGKVKEVQKKSDENAAVDQTPSGKKN